MTVPYSSIQFDEGLYPRVNGHDPEVVQTYARDMDVANRFGILHMHSRGKDIAWVDSGSVIHPRSDRELAVAVWRKWLDDAEINPACVNSESEEYWRDLLITQLKNDGYQCQKEVCCRHGRIDVLATKRGNELLIEVKVSVSINNISSALGQLLFYRESYPSAKLLLAVPQEIDVCAAAVLASHGVSIIKIEG